MLGIVSKGLWGADTERIYIIEEIEVEFEDEIEVEIELDEE